MNYITMSTLFPITKGAEISECQKYRYKLWRIWDRSLPCILFVMLNPSTADHNKNDPTVKRCISFAKSWGYGGIYIGNQFAFRATSPKDLLKEEDPVGDNNVIAVHQMEDICDQIVFAWGNSSVIKKLGQTFHKTDFDKPVGYIDLSKDNTPKHPLYLKGDLKLKLYEK